MSFACQQNSYLKEVRSTNKHFSKNWPVSGHVKSRGSRIGVSVLRKRISNISILFLFIKKDSKFEGWASVLHKQIIQSEMELHDQQLVVLYRQEQCIY